MRSALIIFIAFGLYSVVHSMLASMTFKEWARKLLGAQVDRYYRLFFNFVGGVTLLPFLALPVWLADQPMWSIPLPWVILTGAIQIGAALALLASVLQGGTLAFIGFSQAFGSGDPQQSEILNTGGLYQFMRHPLYTFSMLFLWLTPIMTLNLLALTSAISLYFVVGAMFEERKLERQFGDAYRDYKKRVKMFIPFVI